jgi:hypothetical protein
MYILIRYILQQTNVETYTWKTRAVCFFAQIIHWKVTIPYYQWFFSPPVAPPEIGKTGRPDGYDGGHPPQQLRLSYSWGGDAGLPAGPRLEGDLMGF